MGARGLPPIVLIIPLDPIDVKGLNPFPTHRISHSIDKIIVTETGGISLPLSGTNANLG